jgi:hypothetical protein
MRKVFNTYVSSLSINDTVQVVSVKVDILPRQTESDYVGRQVRFGKLMDSRSYAIFENSVMDGVLRAENLKVGTIIIEEVLSEGLVSELSNIVGISLFASETISS